MKCETMTRDEHIALLGRGAASWNAWRAGHDEAPDLSSAALRGLDLSGFDLSRADLRGADLRGAQCRDTNLSRARMEGANLFKAVLDGANLAGAFLYGAQGDTVADPSEDAAFAARLRSAGASAQSAVYVGNHSLTTLREHLDEMVLFAGRGLFGAS